MAVYDSDLKAYVVTNIVLSDKDELTPVSVPFNGAVVAVNINYGDHAYAKVRCDERTLETFMNRLSSFEEYLERAVVWRQLWHAVLDGEFSSLKFLELVKS